MKVLLKGVAVLLVAVAAFLIYAVLHAMASAGGAKTGVSILYVVIALALAFTATNLWRRSTTARATTP